MITFTSDSLIQFEGRGKEVITLICISYGLIFGIYYVVIVWFVVAFRVFPKIVAIVKKFLSFGISFEK